MVWKKGFATVSAFALLGCVGVTVQPAYATGDSTEQTELHGDQPHRVVEGGDFKTATLKGDRLLETYRLTKYDVLDIQIVGFSTFESSDSAKSGGLSNVTIGPDGYVQLPYAGSIKLAGLTLDEARDLISERLRTYLRFPDLSIIVKTYGPRKIYVMGEVKTPGIHELGVDSLNAYAAISSAGGVTRRGRSTQVQVLRVVGDTMYYKQLNIKNYVKKHDLTQNVVLQDGDIVYVPRSNGIKFDEDILPYFNVWTMYKALKD